MRIITGRARGLKLLVPKNMDVRPTADRVKESLFSIIGSKIISAKVLDLFAGTGNLGLESWSRGASEIVFIDCSNESLKLVKGNIEKCRATEDCRTYKKSAISAIEHLYATKERFDFIFCDPPYNKGWVQKVIEKLGECNVLKKGGYLVVERSAHDVLGDLPQEFFVVREENYGETIITFINFTEC